VDVGDDRDFQGDPLFMLISNISLPSSSPPPMVLPGSGSRLQVGCYSSEILRYEKTSEQEHRG
jgi:hypothetical protein